VTWNFQYDMEPHVTYLVVILHTPSTTGNPTFTQVMALVEDIAAISELETARDAIIIVQDESGYLCSVKYSTLLYLYPIWTILGL
jgi:hypothetical protein